jgi:hypothetical protein
VNDTVENHETYLQPGDMPQSLHASSFARRIRDQARSKQRHMSGRDEWLAGNA